MANVDDDRMRSEIRELLTGADLASISIGKLRGMLEERLGLGLGTLESRKEHVNGILKQELVNHIQGKAKEKAAPAAKEAGKRKVAATEETSDKKAKVDSASKDASGDAPAELEKAPASPIPDFDPAEAEKRLAVNESLVAKLPKVMALSGAEDGALRLWDLEAFVSVRVMLGHEAPIRVIDVEWEEMQAVSGSDDGARLWDLKRGESIKAFDGAEEGCAAVAVDWSNQRCAGGCGDGHLRLWNLGAGSEAAKSIMAHHGGVWAVAANWAKQKIVSAGDLEFKVWDAEDLECLKSITGHPGGIMSLSADIENDRVLVGTGERGSNNLRMWTTETAKALQSLVGHNGAVAHISVNWEDEVAVSGGWDGSLRVWNLEKGTCSHRHVTRFGRVRSMDVDFDKLQAMCGAANGELHLVDLRTGAPLRKMEGHVGAVTALRVKF